jgi:hypothetical protein
MPVDRLDIAAGDNRLHPDSFDPADIRPCIVDWVFDHQGTWEAGSKHRSHIRSLVGIGLVLDKHSVLVDHSDMLACCNKVHPDRHDWDHMLVREYCIWLSPVHHVDTLEAHSKPCC